jgi:hypothetical protein
MKQPLGKAAKCPLFPLNLRLLFQKLKFWNSFLYYKKGEKIPHIANFDEKDPAAP